MQLNHFVRIAQWLHMPHLLLPQVKLTKAEEKKADAIWVESLKKAKALFDDGSVEVTKQVSYKPSPDSETVGSRGRVLDYNIYTGLREVFRKRNPPS